MNSPLQPLSDHEKQGMASASDVLSLMSHPQRLAILCYLGRQEASVSELLTVVESSQSALSQHLAKLKAAGLVQARREENRMFYRLKSEEVRTIIGTLRQLFC